METVCRLCAKEKLPKQLTHSIDDHTLNIEQKLIDCCCWNSIVATECETLPTKICNSCYRKLNMSWSFAESVAQAQQQIFAMFVEEKPVLPSIEHVEVKDTVIKDEPLEFYDDISDQNEQNESLESNEANASESANDIKEPMEMLELVLKPEDNNPSDHDELMEPPQAAANSRPKRKRKPVLKEYQVDPGNDKAKNKAKDKKTAEEKT